MGARKPLLLRLAISILGLGSALLVCSAAEIKNSACLDCHSDSTLTKTNAVGKEVSLFVDVAKLAASAHKTNTCASCHSDLTLKHPDDNLPASPVNCKACHERQTQTYGASVHGVAFTAGRHDSATCQDCHDSHEVLPPSSTASPLHFSKQAATCGQCHEREARDLAASVHGKATADGKRDAPTCTDCHSEHKIQALTASSPLKISSDVCSQCHASERLNTKYNLPPDRVKTFFESYHGLAAQYGSTLAANCGSCHGSHRVLRSSDPDSTIHKTHLVETCGKCHPGASEKFALSAVHVDNTKAAGAGDLGGQINWWVRRIYLLLIVVVIGSMLFHNGLHFLKKLRAIYGSHPRTILRMTLSQRIQHLILGTSFIVLAVTGFALKFPDSWIARALGSNEPLRSWTHRVAAVIMLLLGAYHIIYIVATRDGRKLVRDFLPSPKDLRDVLGNLRYFMGLSSKRPQLARFGYAEKAEYWAVIWGTVIMGVSGLMIWFKMDVTRFLPRWAVDVATTVHYYEAVLACLAIVVWHFYHVIFDPEVYPFNLACFDGRVSEHWQHEEHPLDPAGHAERLAELPQVHLRETPALVADSSAPGRNGNGHPDHSAFDI
jgi:cytochrome b subunit of formate dehydrogenase